MHEAVAGRNAGTKRTVTPEQRLAIEEAVSILAEDNRSAEGALASCAACGRNLADGSVAYEAGISLCGGCGTAYEIARIEGRAGTAADYATAAARRVRRAS